ncbi:MAG: M23 family metallopeptidase, partial [Gammaproteobacteria bacterium]|nr:M23 family metallopeptidase [Gammaproteobacteria bacterium]
ATTKDWNHDTFWYEPWGSSGVHKGIDVFSSVGKPVVSSTYGVVLFKGNIEKGGNVVVILGPKWRIHYYAHLNEINESLGAVVSVSEIIGGVGNSGNAKDKPPHLHYTILTLLPYIWRIDTSTQGWKKIFFLNPSKRLLEVHL